MLIAELNDVLKRVAQLPPQAQLACARLLMNQLGARDSVPELTDQEWEEWRLARNLDRIDEWRRRHCLD